MPQLLILHLILAAVLRTPNIFAQNTEIGTKVQDLTTYPAFSQQKSCAQSCFVTGAIACFEDILGVRIGCAQKACQPKTGMARNDCYCSAGLMKPAQEFLSGCVSSACNVGDVSVDISIATSIYSRYCDEKGYTAGEPVKIPATATPSTSRTVITRFGAGPTSTGTASSTVIGTNDNPGTTSNSAGSSALSIGSIIGIVVGACAGLAFLAAAMWIFWKLFKLCRGDRRPPQQYEPPSLHQIPVYPNMPQQQQWYPSPGPASDIGPSDSISMVGGMARPAPTLVSDMRYQGRW